MLTWLSGAPSASATKSPDGAGCTRRASHGRGRCDPVIRSSASGMCCCRSALPRRIRRLTRPEMPEDPAAGAAVARRLADAGVRIRNPVIVVHVSAGNPFRRWPSASFVELVCRLASKDPKRRIILTSGPSDAAGRGAPSRETRAHGCTAEIEQAARRVRRFQPGGVARARCDEPRCTSAATAARSISQARRACRLWDCMDRHCRCARSRSAARASSAQRQKYRICRAARATNGDASPAIFGA